MLFTPYWRIFAWDRMARTEPRCGNASGAYSGCEAAGSCPCSAGPVGQSIEVAGLRDLVRSRLASSIVRWPKVSGPDGVRQQLFWLRKFRGVSIPSSQAFPACVSRASTLAGACDIPFGQLLQPPPADGKNRTRSRPVFWLAFAWSQQYAHWTLEHLPRLWYFLQLGRLLQRTPILLVPRSLASWQLALLEAIPTAYPTPMPRATLLSLSP